MPSRRLDDIRSADGTRLALHRWDAAGQARRDVLLVHGFADHMGRYAHVGDALAAAGHRVTGVDLRGHGRSDGRRGHVSRWQDYIDDVRAAVEAVGDPVLLSHSMGSLVVLDYLREHRAPGAILSAPLLRATVEAPRWKKAIAGTLSRVLPRVALANEIPAAHVSRHPEVVKAYGSDPLVFSTVTPRWYTEMVAAAARVVAHASRYRTPALLMWGTDDRIVDPAAVEELATAWPAVATRRWPGLYHEIFNDPERDEVLAEAIRWLESLDSGALPG